MILLIFFALLLAVLIHLFIRIPYPKKLNDVYSVPSKYYPLKFFLIKKLVAHRQSKTRASNAAPAHEAGITESQFGGSGKRSPEYLEKKHVLPAGHDRAGDCIFWNASNEHGWWFALGMAQRPNDVINLFLVVKVPGVGTFVNDQLPTTSNVKSKQSDESYETESGFHARCIRPMEEWGISFQGSLIPAEHCKPKLTTGGKGQEPANIQKVVASFELTWTNYGEYFDFDVDVSAEAVARSLAREPWSRELFKKLKETHQSHYEQFGHLSGQFQIGEQSFNDVKMVSMRDHTITKYRNWSQIRRYIMIVYHLEDGTCINTSLVSMPEAVFTHLEFGYIITPYKKKVAVDRINISLNELGEDKNFPRQFEYTFRAGPYFYTVKVTAKEVVSFKMGLDLACYVQEHMCEFRANGMKGWGFAEVEYRISPY